MRWEEKLEATSCAPWFGACSLRDPSRDGSTGHSVLQEEGRDVCRRPLGIRRSESTRCVYSAHLYKYVLFIFAHLYIGTRSDLLEIQAAYDAGAPLRQVMRDNFASWCRHNRAFKEYKRVITEPRNFKSKCFLFVGPPGQGKSTVMKLVASRLGTSYKVPQPKGSGTYYDDYDGQDVIIFDEFDGHFMKPTDFNMICDEHECVLTVHGGAGHQLVSKYIFIGSNYMPSQWWKKRNAAQLRQITRRIDVIFKVGFVECVKCLNGLLCAIHHDKPYVSTRFGLGPTPDPNVDEQSEYEARLDLSSSDHLFL